MKKVCFTVVGLQNNIFQLLCTIAQKIEVKNTVSVKNSNNNKTGMRAAYHNFMQTEQKKTGRSLAWHPFSKCIFLTAKTLHIKSQ